jgi:hypothetical protein
MAELLAEKKETKLLPLITDGRLGYLGINKDKMRFWGVKKRGKAIGGNGGHVSCPVIRHQNFHMNPFFSYLITD